jgi:adenosylcobinamide-GDP ribazoletransferase
LALILSIGLRSSLLARLDAAAMAGLVSSQSVARLAPAYLMTMLPYVTPAGARSRGVVRAGGVQVMCASGSALAILVVVGLLGGVGILEGLVMIAGLVSVVVLCGRLFERRAGGITGDFLGASEQVGEGVVLIAMVTV